MSIIRFLFFITSMILMAEDCLLAQSYVESLKSSDKQVRCDAFYELFGKGERGETEKSNLVYGKTTTKVHKLLGKPTTIYALEYMGVKWLRVQYVFDTCPSKASIDEIAACKNGWRFGPSVLFRNGISVPENVFGEETGETRYSITPEHLRFRKGGVFP